MLSPSPEQRKHLSDVHSAAIAAFREIDDVETMWVTKGGGPGQFWVSYTTVSGSALPSAALEGWVETMVPINYLANFSHAKRGE